MAFKHIEPAAHLALVKRRSTPPSGPNEFSTVECSICSGVEMVEGPDGWGLCVCRKERIQRSKIEKIPLRYRGVDLMKLKARAESHPSQAEIIRTIQTSPFESYLLVGRNGAGRSHLMWALYRYVLDSGRAVAACSAIQLLNEFRSCFQATGGEIPHVTVTGADLRKRETCSVFLDDIDKTRPTEYAAEQLFDLIDAAYSCQHQLVVTSNLTTRELADHFSKADPRYGLSIVRRLADGHVITMF